MGGKKDRKVKLRERKRRKGRGEGGRGKEGGGERGREGEQTKCMHKYTHQTNFSISNTLNN